MKILKHTLNIVIWTLLGLYVLLLVATSIPAVQRYAGRRLAQALAGKLGTSVSIESAEYSLLSHLTIKNLRLKDQRGLDMLAARRLSASLDLLPLAEGRVSIASAQLFGVVARLYQATADDKPNFQFVIDSLASKDTTTHTPLNLRINSLIVRHSRVTFDQLDAPATPGKMNGQHLSLSDISAHIILKTLTDDSLNVNIKRLSMKEKSGLQIDRLRMRLEAGRNQCRLRDFMLLMPGTEFHLGPVDANYRLIGDSIDMRSLTYAGSIRPSRVTLADVACLLPSLKTFQSTLSVAADLSGTGDRADVRELTVSSTTGDISVNISTQLNGLQRNEPAWSADINDLTLSANAVSFISENLKGQRIEVPDEVARLGSIHLRGTAKGVGLSEIDTHGELNTDAGSVALSLTIDGQRNFQGSIDTRQFDMRRLLDDPQFGTLATTINVSGTLPAQGSPTVSAEGEIGQLQFRGYNYQHISVDGHYAPTDIHGRLSIDDEHIAMAIEGYAVKEQRQSNVKVKAQVHHIAPQAIQLSDQWGDAVFSGTLDADFHASDLNDAEGFAELTDVNMRSPREQYRLERLRVESGFSGDSHYVSMTSDFGEARLTGHFDYNTLAQSVAHIVADKMPTLPGLPATTAAAKNDFAIHASINKSDWMQHLLNIPLRLTQPLTLAGMVNDQTRQLTLACDIPQFYYNDSRYDYATVSVASPHDTLFYKACVTKMMDDGDHFYLEAEGHAQNNQLLASLLWDNHQEARISGQLTTTASFDTSMDGRQTTYVSIKPSQVQVRNATWDIQPCQITYYDKHLDINNFSIGHQQQYLRLDGTASQSGNDTMKVSMKDMDVDYILDLVNFHAVDFSGYATGGGSVRGLFGDFEADGRLTVRDFEFQHGRMGTLEADVTWNSAQQQIDIDATADDGPDAMTRIKGYVSPGNNFIDLGITAEGTHLDFAQSFTESFISSIDGHANGQLRLAGPLDAINLTGGLTLNGRAHISTLNCTYEMRNDTLRFVPNEIEFVSCPVYDTYGNRGTLTGGIHHQELTNLTYDIYVDAQNLLAYDFKHFGGATFCGTVFANGHVAIHGRDGSLLIEADVTPQPNSVFIYNAASPDDIGDQQFIEWNTHPTPQDVHQPLGIHQPQASPEQHNQPQPTPEYRSDVTMNMKINATPDATIRLLMDERTNDYITLRGNGELRTTFYNKGGFSMFGTYRITEGTYGLTIQNIIRKNFIFREGGTVGFGGDPYEAALNLQAQHTVNGVSLSDLNVGRSFSNTVRVNCLMNITGQPRQPSVDFDMEMPNVNADEQQMVRSLINSEEEMNQQVVYLLAVGRFYPQGANNATQDEGSTQSKTSLAMQSLLSGTLSGQINNVLGQVIKSNKWNFGANISTGDEGWNNAEYEGLISGRLLNNRLLINGQFGYRDNAATATTSFIGDFDIRYLLFPNGNMALKVYNQTNDRYFTKSSLNTQGLGIILKKDFNGLDDLFGKRRKEKKQKAK